MALFLETTKQDGTVTLTKFSGTPVTVPRDSSASYRIINTRPNTENELVKEQVGDNLLIKSEASGQSIAIGDYYAANSGDLSPVIGPNGSTIAALPGADSSLNAGQSLGKAYAGEQILSEEAGETLFLVSAALAVGLAANAYAKSDDTADFLRGIADPAEVNDPEVVNESEVGESPGDEQSDTSEGVVSVDSESDESIRTEDVLCDADTIPGTEADPTPISEVADPAPSGQYLVGTLTGVAVIDSVQPETLI